MLTITIITVLEPIEVHSSVINSITCTCSSSKRFWIAYLGFVYEINL